MPDERRVSIVRPTLGSHRGYPMCPSHRREMRPRVVLVFDDGLTFMGWACPRGCSTPWVPILPDMVELLGPVVLPEYLPDG